MIGDRRTRKVGQHLVEGVDPRLVRQGEIGVAPAVEDRGPAGMDTARELGRQAGLPRSRLTADEHDATARCVGVVPHAAQLGHGLGPPDERISRPGTERERHWWWRCRHLAVLLRCLPPDEVGVDPVRQPLELERADGLVAVARSVAGEQAHRVADEDLAALRRGLQPGRRDHRQAEALLVLPGHVAGGDSDPHGQVVRRLAHPDLQRDGGPHGLRGGLERRHHAFTARLDDPSAVAQDHVGELVQVVDEEAIRPSVTEVDAHRRRSNDIGEQDRGGGRTPLRHFRSSVTTWDTLGMRATQSQDTVLDRAFVPDELVPVVCPAGFAGAGLFQVAVFAWALMGFASVYLGAARRAFDMTIERMPQRTSVALTRSMAHHPEVQHHLAEMRMAYDAAEAMLERTASDWTNGVDHSDWPVRLIGTRQVVINNAYDIVDRALDLSGGAGAFKRNRLEQLFRDVRMGRFHPGNTLLAHELIGKLCLGLDPEDPQRWG
jgi:hypothetical protein